MLVTLAPCVRVKLLGDAETAKFPSSFTVRVTVVTFIKLPDMPVIITVAVPTSAVPLAVSIKVLVVDVLLGLKDVLTPLGRPEADKLTSPLKPFWGVTVIVIEPVFPRIIVTLLGEPESKKFGPETGQLFTRLAALTLPIPVAKSQPVVAPYEGLNELSDVERTPTEPSAK